MMSPSPDLEASAIASCVASPQPRQDSHLRTTGVDTEQGDGLQHFGALNKPATAVRAMNFELFHPR